MSYDRVVPTRRRDGVHRTGTSVLDRCGRDPFGHGLHSQISSPGSDTTACRTLPAIDWDVAKERLGGGTDVLREFADLVKQEVATQRSQIHRAIETRDFKLLRRAAHTMKGSVVYFGAEPLVQAALAVESLGRAESWNGCAELCLTLESELVRFLAVLDAELPLTSNGA